MTGTDIALMLLALIDVAALSIGISIRRKVVGIVSGVGAEIQTEVKNGIATALAQLLSIARAVIPEDDPRRAQLEGAEDLISSLR